MTKTLTEICLTYGYYQPAIERALARGISFEEALKNHDDGNTRLQNRLNSKYLKTSDRMRQFRRMLNLTQSQFADVLFEICGEHYSTLMISSVENGRKCYKLSTMIALCRFSGYSLDYLLGRSNEKIAYTPPIKKRNSAEQIISLCTYRNISENELRKKVLENGNGKTSFDNLGIDSLVAIADILEVSTDYIAGLTDDMYRY